MRRFWFSDAGILSAVISLVFFTEAPSADASNDLLFFYLRESGYQTKLSETSSWKEIRQKLVAKAEGTPFALSADADVDEILLVLDQPQLKNEERALTNRFSDLDRILESAHLRSFKHPENQMHAWPIMQRFWENYLALQPSADNLEKISFPEIPTVDFNSLPNERTFFLYTNPWLMSFALPRSAFKDYPLERSLADLAPIMIWIKDHIQSEDPFVQYNILKYLNTLFGTTPTPGKAWAWESAFNYSHFNILDSNELEILNAAFAEYGKLQAIEAIRYIKNWTNTLQGASVKTVYRSMIQHKITETINCNSALASKPKRTTLLNLKQWINFGRNFFK